MINAQEYYELTNELAPEDFEACKAAAEEMLHAATLYAYVGRDIATMPAVITTRWKRALALQTQAISLQGGVAALHDGPLASASLGKFSYSTGAGSLGSLSPAVFELVAVLTAFGRGLPCCEASP